MMNFNNNEQTASSDTAQETVTYPTGPITAPPVEEVPVVNADAFPVAGTSAFPVEETDPFPKEELSEPYYPRETFYKEKFPTKVKVAIILTIVIAVSLIAVAAMGFAFYHKKTTSRISSLETQVNDLTHDNNMLVEEKKLLSSEHSGEIADLNEQIDRMEEEISELSEKADFMDRYIKVVEDDTYNTYHTYGCEYFDDSYFWAYNKEQVVNNSNYSRCPYCN